MARPRSCDCGECAKCRHRDYMRTWYENKPGYAAAMVRKRRQQSGDELREYDRNRYHNDPEFRVRHEARQAVHAQIRRGTIVPEPCAHCGTPERIEAHHPDYSRPLEVMWLCSTCHVALHRAEREAAA